MCMVEGGGGEEEEDGQGEEDDASMEGERSTVQRLGMSRRAAAVPRWQGAVPPIR